GQPEATRRAADVLPAAKARLSRPRRPIASLLFVGPTGVGKTELAKAFAEFLFGHRDRLTRFDMSEFADRVGWLRLIGSGPGSEGLLTSRLREQPFSVVLLDEFEKAHPAFFDLLLQILGDARLTDSAGRLADFRNAVVILTSNLGAQTFHRGVVGFDGADQAIRTAGAHFVEAVRSGLRPELYNRIDHVIPFLPLSRSAMLAIARREIELALGRDGFRHMRVELAPGVTEQLALAGYDARLGARPLKRALERQLLEPLARARCARPESVRLRARVGPGAEALAVEVEVEPQRPGRPALEYRNWDDLVGEARELRLSVRALGRCTALLELQNEAFAAEKLQERLLAGGPGRSRPETKRRQAPGSDERLRRLGRIRQLVTRASCLTASASSLEETVLAELYGPRTGVDLGAAGREAAWAECERLRAELGDVMRELLVMRTARANAIVLAIYGEHPGCLFTLAQLYHDVGGLCGFDRRVVALRPPVPGSAGADHLSGQVLASPDRELAGGLQGPVVGILLAFGGLHAKLLFAPEAGSHIFTSPDRNKERRCLVEALDKELGEIEIPAVMARRGQIPDAPRRRAYDRSARSMEDELLHVSSPLDAQELHRLLRDGMLREAVDLLDR
ncbi:MAG: ATP-dependent Clp protease ATP-binding subunit, partial [Candidatus Riflebacteria bacterium]|nr:ATP-dependent Clp protease ATP-binding subunit [Candidatus Riflebacteria bacterium]